MRRKKSLKYLLMFLGLIGVTYEGALHSSRASEAKEQRTADGKKVVATVNGKPIYDEQISIEAELSKFRKYGMRDESPELVQRLRRKALDKVISEELILQESRKLTINDLDEKVNQKLEALQKKKRVTGERFEEYLKEKNLTLEEARESFRARIQVEEYLKVQGISEPEIPEARIREAYERNSDSYFQEETIQVSHILIAVDDGAEPEASEQARQKAEKIRSDVSEGKDFADMAKEHSACNSASGGGRLGYIKRGFMPAEFDQVAFALEKDAVSEVVKTKFGYHIIKVVDKKPAGVTPYEKVRDFFRLELQEKESKKKLAAHIETLKEKARIEVYE
jgi:peptidyl-prolyl cis-trans isomerase C